MIIFLLGKLQILTCDLIFAELNLILKKYEFVFINKRLVNCNNYHRL